MSLVKGSSRAAISKNIETEKAAGKPQAQAVAIALHTADQSKSRTSGGMSTHASRRRARNARLSAPKQKGA